MKVNFNQLSELMNPLTQMCKKEKVVDLSGTKVVLRILTPLEETNVQRLLPEIDESPMSAMEFADIYRRETLARSIVQIDEMDLRGVDEVETGETLPNGVSKKMTKTDALLKIIEGWSRPVLSKLFEQYGLLSEEIELEMDDSLKMNIEKKEALEENLNQRLADLQKAESLQEISNGQEVP